MSEDTGKRLQLHGVNESEDTIVADIVPPPRPSVSIHLPPLSFDSYPPFDGDLQAEILKQEPLYGEAIWRCIEDYVPRWSLAHRYSKLGTIKSATLTTSRHPSQLIAWRKESVVLNSIRAKLDGRQLSSSEVGSVMRRFDKCPMLTLESLDTDDAELDRAIASAIDRLCAIFDNYNEESDSDSDSDDESLPPSLSDIDAEENRPLRISTTEDHYAHNARQRISELRSILASTTSLERINSIQSSVESEEYWLSELEGGSDHLVEQLERVPKQILDKTPGKTCPICKIEFLGNPNPLVVRLPCHEDHMFDLECVEPWLKLKSTCPRDRKKLK